MKKGKHSSVQIVKILQEQQTGKKVAEICRTYGISNATFYRWKSQYSGMSAPDIVRLKELELENNKLKRLYAERCLEIEALKDVLSKKW